ncbi:MAG TPA: ElyC/SanA/YdcF family protein [Mobilitalea sp.]|nr:ElyC/SanA/YdcF family protein [Mobilitalea sp.]
MKRKHIVRRLIIIFTAGAMFCILTIFAINLYVKSSVKNRIRSEEEAALLEADCILILGAGVWDNGKPSQMLRDRLQQGIKLYRAGASDRILMSGDHGRENYDEVNTMKNFAMDMKVPSEHIFMDHAGFSTYDSMYRAKEVFKAKKIIIVTQEYHMYRALYVAKTLGLDAYGVTSDPWEYAGQEYRNAREVAARIKDFIYVIVKPEPTYLGDTIPVYGDGNVTNDK